MKISDYDCFLSDCKKLGGYYIGISGGEPFCNPEAINIIRTAQRKGYRVGIITNGQLINDAILEELIDLNLSRISFSFHGFRKDTYAKHFGVDEKKYDYVLNIIQKLINAECRVGIAYTVTKYNITEFSETKKMFMDMGLKEQDIKFNMLLRGNVDVSDLYPSKAQLADVISQNKEYFRELEKNQSFGLCCAAGRCSFSVNAYGDVYPCTFFNTPAGNLFYDSIIDIWNNSHLFRMFRSLNDDLYRECSKCKIADKCNLCIVDNVNSTDSIFVPNHIRCLSKIDYMNMVNS